MTCKTLQRRYHKAQRCPEHKLPVRVVCKVPKKWDGFCPDCKRGADGFGDEVWCDCEALGPGGGKA